MKNNEHYNLKITKYNNYKDYNQISNLIKNQFYDFYSANVKINYPYIIGFEKNKYIYSALGLRPAQYDKLFLEQYFKYPIEKHIYLNKNLIIKRNNIIELGSMYSKNCLNIYKLLIVLLNITTFTNYKWSVFTSTENLYNFLIKQGYSLENLSYADRNKITDKKNWGMYYDTKPRIVLMDNKKSFKNILSNFKNYIFLSKYQKELFLIKKQIT